MAIDAIKNIGLIRTRKTQKGNDYNETDIGKVTGTALGLGASAILTHGVSKTIKTIDFKKIIVATWKGITDSFDLKHLPEAEELFRGKFRSKALNVGTKTVLGAGIVFLTGVGLLAGTLVDEIINRVNAKNADKKA